MARFKYPMQPDEVTVEEAAELLSMSRKQVHRLMDQCAIHFYLPPMGWDWRAKKKDVLQYLADRDYRRRQIN